MWAACSWAMDKSSPRTDRAIGDLWSGLAETSSRSFSNEEIAERSDRRFWLASLRRRLDLVETFLMCVSWLSLSLRASWVSLREFSRDLQRSSRAVSCVRERESSALAVSRSRRMGVCCGGGGDADEQWWGHALQSRTGSGLRRSEKTSMNAVRLIS